MTITLDLTATLERAHRALAFLEEQAAGYTALTIPVHLEYPVTHTSRFGSR
ncbi:MAG: hypothetical protein J7M17_04350 [Anaerolineae bacterium]|nr:hypothetical protein [Anaerolineae bacterium]